MTPHFGNEDLDNTIDRMDIVDEAEEKEEPRREEFEEMNRPFGAGPSTLKNYTVAHVYENLPQGSEIRRQFSDTILEFFPSMQRLQVSWIHLARYELLNVLFSCARARREISIDPDTGKRLVRLHIQPNEVSAYIHFFEMLHLNEPTMIQYLQVSVRESGDMLPLLEIANSYAVTPIEVLCRNQIAKYTRELLDQGCVEDAFMIVASFTKRRNRLGLDGSFESKGFFELYSHPVIRQVLFFLRSCKEVLIEECLPHLVYLPPMALVHLIIFPGTNYYEKRAFFASALIERAKWLINEAALNPKAADFVVDYDEAIVGCANLDIEQVVETVEALCSHVLVDPYREGVTQGRQQQHHPGLVKRCLSDNYSKYKLDKQNREDSISFNGIATPSPYHSPATRARSLSDVSNQNYNHQRSASSAPSTIILPPLQFVHDLMQCEEDADTMTTTSNDDEVSSQHQEPQTASASSKSIHDFRSIRYQSEITIAHTFELNETKNKKLYLSKREQFHVDVSRFDANVVRINSTLHVQVRLDVTTNEMKVIASLNDLGQNKSVLVSYWIEWDIDPQANSRLQLRSNSVMNGSPQHQTKSQKQHIANFRNTQPITLAAYKINMDDDNAISNSSDNKIAWLPNFQICLLLKMHF